VRALFYSFTYQLGNLASAASSTIEATIGERFPLAPNPETGDPRYDYGKVIGEHIKHFGHGDVNANKRQESSLGLCGPIFFS
jgi:hypothetical protein